MDFVGAFWGGFSEEKYRALCHEIDTATYWPTDFRIAEGPFWIPNATYQLMMDATQAIIEQLVTESLKEQSKKAIPTGWSVPGCDDHPQFIQVDFAMCQEGDTIVPKLIELQGFASMFCYQVLVDRALRKVFDIPEGVSCYHSGLNEESYLAMLQAILLNGHSPENVVLLELQPETQKTRIDFAATEKFFGIRPLCVSEVYQAGRQLFYKDGSRSVPIHRIYNRVILDEFLQKNIENAFDIRADVDVEWCAHPDWFLRMSKYSMPFLDHPSVPKTYFVDQFPGGESLEGWVLKPLYSFAGAGVNLKPTEADIQEIERPGEWILQRKVEYAACVPTPDSARKAEVRIMVFWDKEPVIANTLVRLSQGATSNVAANRTDRFVGATTGYHR